MTRTYRSQFKKKKKMNRRLMPAVTVGMRLTWENNETDSRDAPGWRPHVYFLLPDVKEAQGLGIKYTAVDPKVWACRTGPSEKGPVCKMCRMTPMHKPYTSVVKEQMTLYSYIWRGLLPCRKCYHMSGAHSWVLSSSSECSSCSSSSVSLYESRSPSALI